MHNNEKIGIPGGFLMTGAMSFMMGAIMFATMHDYPNHKTILVAVVGSMLLTAIGSVFLIRVANNATDREKK